MEFQNLTEFRRASDRPVGEVALRKRVGDHNFERPVPLARQVASLLVSFHAAVFPCTFPI